MNNITNMTNGTGPAGLPADGAASAPAPAPSAANDADADAEFRGKAALAAEKFEGFFISQMLKGMRSATRELAPEDSVFKDKVGGDMLEFADHLLADQMAGQRAFGIADAILRQLLPTPAALEPERFKNPAGPVASASNRTSSAP